MKYQGKLKFRMKISDFVQNLINENSWDESDVYSPPASTVFDSSSDDDLDLANLNVNVTILGLTVRYFSPFYLLHYSPFTRRACCAFPLLFVDLCMTLTLGLSPRFPRIKDTSFS